MGGSTVMTWAAAIEGMQATIARIRGCKDLLLAIGGVVVVRLNPGPQWTLGLTANAGGAPTISSSAPMPQTCPMDWRLRDRSSLVLTLGTRQRKAALCSTRSAR